MNTRKSLYDIKSFYDKKAVLKASFEGMRYQVERTEDEQEDEKLLVTIWPEPFCFEKTDKSKKTSQKFSYDEAGLDAAYEWLCESYDQQKEYWEHARDFPLE